MSSSKVFYEKKIIVKIASGVLILLILFVLGCGSAGIASQKEEKAMPAKNEVLPSPATGKAGSAGVFMRVLWTVSKYQIGHNALWGEKEARAMLFKPLDITATTITFDGKTCQDVTFQKEVLKTKEYLASAFLATPQELGIADDVVEVVKTNCDLPGFKQYIRLKDKRLVIYLNGVFFYFDPNLNY